MKNIHKIGKELFITSDEEIKEDTKPCWCIDAKDNSINYYQGALPLYNYIGYKKIILTTDQSLDGVQAIDDEFLQWIVKNPSCDEVEVGYGWIRLTETDNEGYWVSIPDKQFEMQQEEPKQETLNAKQNTHFVDFSNPNGDKNIPDE
jgi:hypothetical protein